MIEAIATRRISHDGKSYEKGDKVQMPLQQFNDLEPTGMVERAHVEKAEPKPAKAG